MKINAVFDGGGVKGFALAGAIEATESLGYEFNNVAGSSSGSLVAAFVAAGYTGKQMGDSISSLDCNAIQDGRWFTKIPLFGHAFAVYKYWGLYKGDFLEQWVREQLASKNISNFGDLNGRLKVVVSDIVGTVLLVLPEDAIVFGIEPNKFDVAKAIRMSISIPFVFEPVCMNDKNGNVKYMVDGSLLSTYPIWLFDKQVDDVPVVGYQLVEPADYNKVSGVTTYAKSIFNTLTDAYDTQYMDQHKDLRSIRIPTLGVNTTDFNISLEIKQNLFNAGKNAALQFFQTWDLKQTEL